VNYFILFFAVACIAIQFSINKFYQKRFVTNLKDMLFFPFVCGAIGALFFIILGICMYGKLPAFSLFSLCLSFILAVISTLSCLIGILVMKYGKISAYSIFMMLGGMILPYFYGVLFLNEKISLAQGIGMIILICALPCTVVKLPDEKKGSSKFYYILCILIFFLNGIVSIISKTHSINISAVPAENFIFYSNLWQTALTGIAYFIFASRLEQPQKADYENIQKSRADNNLAFLTLTAYSVISGIGFLFQLISAKTTPAVILYPFITSGSIVLSILLARVFFREKLRMFTIIGISLAIIGTLLCS